ncbi:MAG: TetR/AcrR family transcriptional regulator [Oscillospiraceae bacterium]|nr:TetR/AcrR family transcriptional regulator [Oscillospiraceae bacterium]
MAERIIQDFGYNSETKNSIVYTAVKLFALKGFNAVGTRDIAKAVGMNIASIYYYYESKEALLEDILDNVEKGYIHYYEWLINESKRAESLEEYLDVLFNKELLDMAAPLVCLGISLAIKEQHSNAHAKKLVVELFTEYSIESIKSGFDALVERGIIKPFETRVLATLLSFGALGINDLRLHEFVDGVSPVDHIELYKSIKEHILATYQ